MHASTAKHAKMCYLCQLYAEIVKFGLIGGRSSILPTDWHVLILCIIFHLENLYFSVKWYVEYGNVLLNLISQWNLCQYITFYRNHNFV